MKLDIVLIMFVAFSTTLAQHDVREEWYPFRFGNGHVGCSNRLGMSENDFCRKLCNQDGKWRNSKCKEHYCYCGPQRFYRVIKL
uniref:KTx n=1 Tax=Tityus melici TaxID=3026321 RepID=A0AA49QCL9_9SCOR|nr:putative KTx [Tityus melici]